MDWADEIADGLVAPGDNSFRDTDEERRDVAAALRKAKADGYAMAAKEYAGFSFNKRKVDSKCAEIEKGSA